MLCGITEVCYPECLMLWLLTLHWNDFKIFLFPNKVPNVIFAGSNYSAGGKAELLIIK